MMNQIRVVMLLGGVLLLSVGCMTPMYRIPAGYSGSYARHLARAVGTPTGDVSEEVSAAATTGPSEIRSRVGNRRVETRGAEQTHSWRPRTATAPASEHPPQPPR